MTTISRPTLCCSVPSQDDEAHNLALPNEVRALLHVCGTLQRGGTFDCSGYRVYDKATKEWRSEPLDQGFGWCRLKSTHPTPWLCWRGKRTR